MVKNEPVAEIIEESPPAILTGVLKNVKTSQIASEIPPPTKVTPANSEPKHYHQRSNSKNSSSHDETNVKAGLRNFNKILINH